MNKKKLVLLSVSTGLLLTPAWYAWGHGLILMIALIPLLYVEDYLDKEKSRYGSGTFFLYASLAFLIWNTATVWWIYNATAVGVVAAILIDTFMWSVVVWLFHLVKRKLGSHSGYFSLILFWTAWEYFYHNAEISFPWLTLGNGFAYNIRLIQWYEYTGVMGGSVWVLLVNILLYNLLKGYMAELPGRRLLAQFVLIVVIIAGPVAISLVRFTTYQEKPDPKTVVVIQPNIDPYEKFVAIPSMAQTMIQLNEAAQAADTAVDYFIAPETSINNDIWIDQIEQVPDIRAIREFLGDFPGAAYIPGIQCYRRCLPGEKTTSITREIPEAGIRYESYNAAIQLDSTANVPFYFKSKLVVGVEKMPYANYLSFLEKFTVRLGGTMRGWGTQDYRGVFFSSGDSTGVSPIICYESVYGEFVTGYVKNGANLLFVITNDGWWGDTPGYHQHNSFSSLRAIETRRSIARSANTGISCLINQRGEIIQQLGWWKRGALKDTLNANDEITWYVKHGDYIGRTASFFSMIMILLYLIRCFIDRRPTKTAFPSPSETVA
jgi:apolipoprotein N-acyltransferase